MSFVPPGGGERAGLSFIEPRTVDDLIRRRDMVKTWMDATCGMFGRSPDFLNIMLTGLSSAAPEFAKREGASPTTSVPTTPPARERDLCMTHTLLNPQVDRSRPVERQEKDLAAKIVKETDAGIVIRGARMVATLCAYSDEILVLPSTFLATNAEAAPYAFGFSIPVAAPGLRFVCRPSVVHRNAASAMDYPLSSRLDEGDGLAVFDDALVPWERVFIHRDPEMCNGLFQRTQAMPQVMHQTSTKNLAKAEFMMALGFAIARSTNIDAHLHVQGMLAELIQHHRVRPLLHPRQRGRRRGQPARDHDSGGDAAVDGADDVPEDVHPRLRDHPDARRRRAGRGALLCGARRPGRGRRRDLRPGGQRGRADPDQVVPPRLRRCGVVVLRAASMYERYYSGDPVRLAGALYALYDKDPHVGRIHDMLDRIEAAGLAIPPLPASRSPRLDGRHAGKALLSAALAVVDDVDCDHPDCESEPGDRVLQVVVGQRHPGDAALRPAARVRSRSASM